MGEKYASELPLPGGVEQYYDTLIALLHRVRSAPMNHEQLVDAIIETCPNATRSSATNSYISSIGRMGLWSAKDGVYRLTDAGDDLLGRAEDDAAAARRVVLTDTCRFDQVLCFEVHE